MERVKVCLRKVHPSTHCVGWAQCTKTRPLDFKRGSTATKMVCAIVKISSILILLLFLIRYVLSTSTHWFSYCVSMVISLGTLLHHTPVLFWFHPVLISGCQISNLLTCRHLIHAKQEGFLYPQGERERSQHSGSTWLWRNLSPWTRHILLTTLEGFLTSDRKSQGKWAVSEQCHMLDSWFLLLLWSHHCTCWLLQTFPCRAELASTPLARPHLISDVVFYGTVTGPLFAPGLMVRPETQAGIIMLLTAKSHLGSFPCTFYFLNDSDMINIKSQSSGWELSENKNRTAICELTKRRLYYSLRKLSQHCC